VAALCSQINDALFVVVQYNHVDGIRAFSREQPGGDGLHWLGSAEISVSNYGSRKHRRTEICGRFVSSDSASLVLRGPLSSAIDTYRKRPRDAESSLINGSQSLSQTINHAVAHVRAAEAVFRQIV